MPEESPLETIAKRIPWPERPWDLLGKAALALVLILLLALMFPRGEQVEFDAKIGAVWAQKDLIAPFSFPILRDELEYSRDVEEARRNVFPVFERDPASLTNQVDSLRNFFRSVRDGVDAFQLYRRSLRAGSPSTAADSAAFEIRSSRVDIPFSLREWEALRGLAESGRLEVVEQLLVDAAGEFLNVGILDTNKSQLGRADIALRRGNVEEIVPAARFHDLTDIIGLLEQKLNARYGGQSVEMALAYKIGVTHILPDVRFNGAATRQAIAAAADAVPRTVGFVQENERIVSKHERIMADTKLKLDSYTRARAERGRTSDRPTQLLGTVLHVAITILLFGIYLYLFRKRIVGSNRKLALIALLMLLVSSAAWVTREVEVNGPVEYLVVIPAASMLLTIFFDSRVGFYGTVILAYLVGGIWGNDYSLALAGLIGGALSVYTVRDMKNRTQIFRSLGYIFLGYAVAIVALGLERYEDLPLVAGKLSYALANAVISPVLTYGLLIFLEKTFRLTTDLTFIELAQFNHPLLRMLAEKAPGTYHHSMAMATLAEAGAAAVGANVVLARVGAYFHDIGKIIKPTYFVENQKGSRNRHDRLAPRMSSLIIAAHVKEGISLAREYRLPEEIVEFIPMHHGTTRMDYFYHKAVELARNSDDETKIDEINEQDYRYPGPRPRTRETGIMMLADAIEAAVRTIEEPTPQRIEDLVNEMVKRRLDDGELDECPLTLADLRSIKAAFVNVLVGIYHSRVRYPEVEQTRIRRPPRRRSAGGEATAQPQPAPDVKPGGASP